MIKLLQFSMFSTCIAVSGCSIANPMNEQGNTMIDLKKKKTWCIGRYSIEVPAEAKFYEQIDNYNAFRIKTVKQNATKTDFDEAINKVKEYYSKGTTRVIINESKVIANKGKSNKIIWGQLNPKLSRVVDIRAFVLDKGYLFSIEADYSPEFESQAKEGIENLVKNLEMRPNNTIPQEKGFCINNGFIKDNGEKYRFSTQRLILDFPQYPSVDFTLESESVYENDGGLIHRMTSNLKEQGNLATILSSAKNIRKGKKQVNQFSGEEWVISVPMKGKNAITAIWAYSGVANNNLYPSIQLDFTNATSLKTKTASISNKEAEILYEELLKSIKLF
jgi:hypothetical protein